MKYDKYKIGERINKERSNRGMTQQDLVNKCHEITGLENPPFSVRAFGSWENGNDSITLKNLILISQALECSVGYLLGEYDKRTLEIEDICNETGLSEEAVKVLKKEAVRIQERNKYNSKYNHPPIENTIKTGFISCLLESSTGIFDTLGDFMQHEADMKEVKKLPFFQDIENLFFEAQKKQKWKFDIKTGELLLKDNKEHFNDALKEFLNKYDDVGKYSTSELVEMITSDTLLSNDKKEKMIERIKEVNLTEEMFVDLAHRKEIYSLLEIEQKKKYFKYELSDNFMDIVKAYVKEGAEDGRKDKLQEER